MQKTLKQKLHITTNIDICIITFKRPALLHTLLKGIANLHIQPNIGINVIVVDNDAKKSAKPIVETMRDNIKFKIIYDVEPKQNIALARNRCLLHIVSEFLAFIDDDEVPEPEWLNEILEASVKHHADVVFGPVIPALPDNVPPWISKSIFFNRPRYKTGQIINEGGIGNTLLRSEIFTAKKFRFNPNFGCTGGEDSELFYRLCLSGKKMIWCDEAVVYENIEHHRLSVNWIIVRSFRCGQGYYRIYVAHQETKNKILWFLTTGRRILTSIIWLFFSLIKGRSVIVEALRETANQIGRISGPLGSFYQEYKKPAK